MAYSSSPPSRSPRLHSLDALRGLDMLIILGLDALVLLLASRNPESAFLQEAARQMTHARWEGLHLYDLVFPVFVFISGVSMSFSLGKYTSGNASSAPGLLHLWKRALVLAFLGLLVNGTLTWTDSMRYASVLGLIGFSCAIAGTYILLCRRTGAIASAAGVILALITLIQFTCGNFTPDGSVNSWVDRHWLPGRLHGGVFDPEGPLCVVSASVLCLGGWLAGKLLKESRLSPARLCAAMAGAGLLLFCAARMLDGLYPIIKSMWTGTFVLAAAGIDVGQWELVTARQWDAPFPVSSGRRCVEQREMGPMGVSPPRYRHQRPDRLPHQLPAQHSCTQPARLQRHSRFFHTFPTRLPGCIPAGAAMARLVLP